MDFTAYFAFIQKILGLIPFNIFDYIIIITLLFYIFEDASFGLVSSLVGFVSTVSSFIVGLIFYHPLSKIIVSNLALPKGISDATAFFFITIVSFLIISALLAFIKGRYLSFFLPAKLDEIGGGIFGLLSYLFVSSFAIALLLSFPISNVVKDSIRNSVSGKFLFSQTQGIEHYVRQIFGGAISDTINFLTIEPSSSQTISLNFKTEAAIVDRKSEEQMLKIVNAKRIAAGFPPLAPDPGLQEVARAHAKDMLARGYFSHYAPDGFSPFDRIEQAGINYFYAGENLAFAPDVEIAMDGLIKSPGHRKNILSPNFRKIGIGVLDAGIFGKMFVQEFTD